MRKILKIMLNDYRAIQEDYRVMELEERSRLKSLLLGSLVFMIFAVGSLGYYVIDIYTTKQDFDISKIKKEYDRNNRSLKAVEFHRTGLDR